MINPSRVIGRLGRKAKFERVTATHEDGYAKEQTEAFEAVAIIQPASKDDLELLEEGQRFFPTVSIFTKAELTVGDFLFYKGRRWKVINAQDWSDNGFHKCIAVRHDGTETVDSEGFTVS